MTDSLFAWAPARPGVTIKDPPGYNKPGTIAARIEVHHQLIAQAQPGSAEHLRLQQRVTSLEKQLREVYARGEAVRSVTAQERKK